MVVLGGYGGERWLLRYCVEGAFMVVRLVDDCDGYGGVVVDGYGGGLGGVWERSRDVFGNFCKFVGDKANLRAINRIQGQTMQMIFCGSKGLCLRNDKEKMALLSWSFLDFRDDRHEVMLLEMKLGVGQLVVLRKTQYFFVMEQENKRLWYELFFCIADKKE